MRQALLGPHPLHHPLNCFFSPVFPLERVWMTLFLPIDLQVNDLVPALCLVERLLTPTAAHLSIRCVKITAWKYSLLSGRLSRFVLWTHSGKLVSNASHCLPLLRCRCHLLHRAMGIMSSDRLYSTFSLCPYFYAWKIFSRSVAMVIYFLYFSNKCWCVFFFHFFIHSENFYWPKRELVFGEVASPVKTAMTPN